MTVASLYVCRPVENAAEIGRWFADQGFPSVTAPGDMHVTVVYSHRPVAWNGAGVALPYIVLPPAPDRVIKPLGDKGAIVMTLESVDLQRRWQQFREIGASWDFDGYRPHTTITWKNPGVQLDRIKPFPGEVRLGPERFREITTGSIRPNEVAMSEDFLDRAVVVQMPTIIKARPVGTDGRRLVEVEASCERVDLDGDVILRDGLLNSAQAFVATGHLDIDHLSEFGARLGIPNPSSYIVGRPREVRKGEGSSTWVLGEISRSITGVHDPARNRYDEFWDSLQCDPPVTWYSSVYGFPIPDGLEDCSDRSCPHGATRFLFKGLDWRSLAFTRNPKNNALTGSARVVAAKSFLADIIKGHHPAVPMGGIPDMATLWAERACPGCAVHKAASVLGYRHHFIACKGLPAGAADVLAHAMMHRLNLERVMQPTFDMRECKSVAA